MSIWETGMRPTPIMAGPVSIPAYMSTFAGQEFEKYQVVTLSEYRRSGPLIEASTGPILGVFELDRFDLASLHSINLALWGISYQRYASERYV
jgi:hypothetical protein